jgi:hypothetical protein
MNQNITGSKRGQSLKINKVFIIKPTQRKG